MMHAFLRVTFACAMGIIPSLVYAHYKDAGGNVVTGYVPLVGCTSSGACTGPASNSAPLPVSASSLPLPSGSATAANQTNVQGIAGTPSATVLTVQGVIGGTNVPVYDATVNSSVNGAIPAGSSVIGKIDIDQTTPGTTNAVQPVDVMFIGPYSCASSGTCSGSAVVIPPFSTAGYGSLSLAQIATGSGGSFVLQGSTDNPATTNNCATATHWQNNIPVHIVSTGNQSFAPTTVGAIVTNVEFPCYQLLGTAYASGTYTFQGSLRAAKAGYDFVLPVLSTANGWTPAFQGAQLASATTIKSAAGQLGSIYCGNPNASVEYVQLFNTSSPTVGSTAPTQSYMIPASSFLNLTFGNPGLNFSTAISIAATTTYNGSTAPGTGLICNEGYN